MPGKAFLGAELNIELDTNAASLDEAIEMHLLVTECRISLFFEARQGEVRECSRHRLKPALNEFG